MKRGAGGPGAAAITAVVLLVLAGCGAPSSVRDPDGTTTTPTTATTAPAPSGPQYGVSLSPLDPQAGFAAFWDEAPGVADVVSWAGLLSDLEDPRGAPSVTAQLAAQHDLGFAMLTSPFQQEKAGFAVPFDEEGQRHWRDVLVGFLNDHEVRYLGLGLEVNYWREVADGSDYATFAAWYDGVAALLADIHPDVAVFPVFQYELMRGMQGGLWGGTNDAPSTWERLDDFPRRDMLAFTMYPGLSVTDPGLLDDAYWQDLARGEPLAVVETGWHAHGDDLGEFASDPEKQARYLDALFSSMPSHDLVLWTFLYDQPGAPPPFSSMGLKDHDGQARPAHARWLARTVP